MLLSGGMLYISLDKELNPFKKKRILSRSLVIFSAILFRTRSPGASVVFWIALFQAVLQAIVVISRSFCLWLVLGFLQRIKIHSLWHRFDLWSQLSISFVYTPILLKSNLFCFLCLSSGVLISKPYSMCENSEWNVSV